MPNYRELVNNRLLPHISESYVDLSAETSNSESLIPFQIEADELVLGRYLINELQSFVLTSRRVAYVDDNGTNWIVGYEDIDGIFAEYPKGEFHKGPQYRNLLLHLADGSTRKLLVPGRCDWGYDLEVMWNFLRRLVKFAKSRAEQLRNGRLET